MSQIASCAHQQQPNLIYFLQFHGRSVWKYGINLVIDEFYLFHALKLLHTHNSHSLKSVEKKLLRICVCGSTDLLWPVKWITGHNNTDPGATSSFKKGAEVTTGHLLMFTVHFYNSNNDPWRIKMFYVTWNKLWLIYCKVKEAGKGTCPIFISNTD